MSCKALHWQTLVSCAAVVVLLAPAGVARAQQSPASPRADSKPSADSVQEGGAESAEEARAEPVGSASGAEGTSAASRALFVEARGLVAKGDYAAACPKFEQAQRLEDGAGIRFNHADCLEHLGRTASAYRLFVEVAEVSEAVDQRERAAVARERAERLAPRLSRVIVEVDERENSGLEVLLDGEVLARSDWGKPRAVDPGQHVVEALSEGEQRWMIRVRAPEAASAMIVSVPRLAERRRAAAAKPLAQDTDKPGTTTQDTDKPRTTTNAIQLLPPPGAPESDSDGGFGVYGWLLIGTGGVALGTSAVLAYLYRYSNSQAEGICPQSVGCSQAEIERHDELVDDARMALRGSWIGLGVGAAALGGAACVRVLRSGPTERGSAASAPQSVAWHAGPVLFSDGHLGLEARGIW